MARRAVARRRLRLGRLIRRTLAVSVLAAVAVSFGAVLALRWIDPPATAMMLEQPTPLASLDRTWVSRTGIAAAAAHAVMASEDQRFLRHNGFDFASIDDALRDYRAGDGLRGASTISQQVAKNLFLWPGKSLVRKGIEAYLTLLIEACWPKRRILEVYLNVAQFGPDLFGVEAAAQRYFHTSAAELTSAQAALLASVLPNPRELHADHPSAYVREREAWVLSQMRRLEASGEYAALAW